MLNLQSQLAGSAAHALVLEEENARLLARLEALPQQQDLCLAVQQPQAVHQQAAQASGGGGSFTVAAGGSPLVLDLDPLPRSQVPAVHRAGCSTGCSGPAVKAPPYTKGGVPHLLPPSSTPTPMEFAMLQQLRQQQWQWQLEQLQQQALPMSSTTLLVGSRYALDLDLAQQPQQRSMQVSRSMEPAAAAATAATPGLTGRTLMASSSVPSLFKVEQQ